MPDIVGAERPGPRREFEADPVRVEKVHRPDENARMHGFGHAPLAVVTIGSSMVLTSGMPSVSR
jgi:hypothetical protein